MLGEREPERQLKRMPDVVGLPMRKAKLLIEHAGLRVSAVLFKESYEEKDTVLQQKPKRGDVVYATEEVLIWVSRESYIKWLPAIYQRSDAIGRNVVRDLLWLIQQMYGSIESQLDVIHQVFDSYETREEFLPWLAAWSAMILEPDWPVNKKRRLIKKAMELYRWRGTVKGLGLFISLFTGFEPHLQENVWPYQGLRIGVSSTVGIDTVILPPVDKSHAFMVVMPHQFKDVTPESIIRLHEIIEMEKPAHTHYMLKFEEARLSVEEREFYRIGVASGINIGQEVVTPLPYNPDTGELDLPKEPQMPEQPPEPSVYDLFGTKKRQLPPITGANKADNAPVEGKEITSSKFGFEGVREFKLDDIMRELLERAGVSVDGGSAAASSGIGGTSAIGEGAGEDTPKVQGTVEVEGGQRPGALGPRIELDLQVTEKEIDEDAAEGTATMVSQEAPSPAAPEVAKTSPAATAGSKPPNPQETVKLGGQLLGDLETVVLAPKVSADIASSLRKDKGPNVEVEVVTEHRDREEIEHVDAEKVTDTTGRTPDNESKK